MRKYLFLVAFSCFTFSCYKPQDRSIPVKGQVLDQNFKGVANVTIYINRGKHESIWPTYYNKYDSVLTNSEGKYSYLITGYSFEYQICCKIPPQYSSVDQFCKEVSSVIIEGKVIPAVINFKLSL
jgi:hypothetical protein